LIIIVLSGVGRISRSPVRLAKDARNFCMDMHDDIR
jgi:hypothetical protein